MIASSTGRLKKYCCFQTDVRQQRQFHTWSYLKCMFSRSRFVFSGTDCAHSCQHRTRRLSQGCELIENQWLCYKYYRNDIEIPIKLSFNRAAIKFLFHLKISLKISSNIERSQDIWVRTVFKISEYGSFSAEKDASRIHRWRLPLHSPRNMQYVLLVRSIECYCVREVESEASLRESFVASYQYSYR